MRILCISLYCWGIYLCTWYVVQEILLLILSITYIGSLTNVSQTNLNNSQNLMENLVKFPVESLFRNQQVALSVFGPRSSRKVLAVVVRRLWRC